MKIHTESIAINAPYDIVFDYIANYDNIPKWSIGFIKKLDKTEKGYVATTPVGKMSFVIASDRKSGVVDLVLNGKPLPTRIVSLGPETLYLFTLILPPDIPDSEFSNGVNGLKEELSLLKQKVEGK